MDGAASSSARQRCDSTARVFLFMGNGPREKPRFLNKRRRPLPIIGSDARLCFILRMVLVAVRLPPFSRFLRASPITLALGLELGAVPVGARRGRLVGGLAEVEQRPARRGRAAHVVVLQSK